MQVYLVQHGLSLPKDQDPEQGLSAKGFEKVNRIAEVAKIYHIKPAKILHSGKKRAEQTAEIFGKTLLPKQGISTLSGIKPMDDVVAFANQLQDFNQTMIIGHLPFMERLVSVMTTQSDQFRVFQFQNGGIVCLTSERAMDLWSIQWSLMPNIG